MVAAKLLRQAIAAAKPCNRVLGARFASAFADGISTHVAEDGRTPQMVDVGSKTATRRTATARCRVRLPPEIVERIDASGGEVMSAKGPVFTTAIIAGIQAAKRTSELIPFCHPLPLEDCQLDMRLVDGGGASGNGDEANIDARSVVQIDCTVRVTHKTGVEMEALVGASVAGLTVYDMLKGLSHNIVIEEARLLSKTGGKRDFEAPPR